MASLANQTISSTYDGLIKTSSDNAVGVSGVQLLQDGSGNDLALSVGRSGNGVTITGNLAVDTNTLYVDASNNRVGVGISSPLSGYKLDVNGALLVRDKIYTLIDGTASNPAIMVNDGDTGLFRPASNNLAISTAGEERMRIDSSGNVGIGTDVTEGKLTINYTAAELPSSGTTSNSAIQIVSSLNNQLNIGLNTASGNYAAYIQSSDNNLAVPYDLHLQPNGGNVGIGTDSPVNITNYTGLTLNNGTNGGFIDLQSNGSTAFRFLTNGSVNNIETRTATPIVFLTNTVEAMRIDSSGNVGINCSANAKLEVKGNLKIQRSSNVETSEITMESGNFDVKASPYGYPIAFHTGTGGSSSERMRITSGGNVLINTDINYSNLLAIDQAANYDGTSDSAGIRIFSTGGTGNSGDYHGAIQFSKGTGSAAISAVQDASDSDVLGLAFFTHPSTSGTAASVERMRITSGGDVLIGTQNTTSFGSGGSGFVAGASNRFILNQGSSITAASTVQAYYNPNGLVGSIVINGSSTAYNTSSDYRLKENVVEMTGALDRVDALKPSRFNFIADSEKTVDGFLAHEVAEVVPEAVTGEKDAVDEEGNPIYQGIDQSKLVPLLVGAIQELRAEIETLKSQLNA